MCDVGIRPQAECPHRTSIKPQAIKQCTAARQRKCTADGPASSAAAALYLPVGTRRGIVQADALSPGNAAIGRICTAANRPETANAK